MISPFMITFYTKTDVSNPKITRLKRLKILCRNQRYRKGISELIETVSFKKSLRETKYSELDKLLVKSRCLSWILVSAIPESIISINLL